MLGFTYKEALHGGFYLLANPIDERAADFVVDVEARDVTALVQSRSAQLKGTIRLEGFADAAPVRGTLTLNAEQKRASYDVAFTGNDAATYRLRGHKEFSWLNVVDSFTLVRASVYDAEAREIGRAVLRFDVRGNWGSLLSSLRFLS
jgi:hypothetical protein